MLLIVTVHFCYFKGYYVFYYLALNLFGCEKIFQISLQEQKKFKDNSFFTSEDYEAKKTF